MSNELVKKLLEDGWNEIGYITDDAATPTTTITAKISHDSTWTASSSGMKFGYSFTVPDGPAYEYGKDWQPAPVSFDPAPIPEAMCPNCRMDRHEFPLTRTMADMWRNCHFSESYDPDADVSPVVCPGSDCCGPAALSRWDGAGKGAYSYGASMVIGGSHAILTWPTWTIKGNVLFKLWDDDCQPITYKVIVGETPAQKAHKQLVELEDTLKSILGANHSWLPADDETVKQAAIEAAPQSVDLEHKLPQSPGFDFSGWNGKPYYYTHMKGKKK